MANIVHRVLNRIVALIIVTMTTAMMAFLSQRLVSYAEGQSSSKRNPVQRSHVLAIESCIEKVDVVESLTAVGGLHDVVDDLRKAVIIPLRYPHLFFGDGASRLHPPRTHLFTGAPGTGKTMVARALAAESGATFLNVGLSVLEDKYFGETPKLLRALFHLARTRAPCIVFFDEVDGCMRRRSSDESASTYSLKTELLLGMDTLSRCADAVYVIACTNHVHSIDAAMKRRFARRHQFSLPDDANRAKILNVLLRDDDSPLSSDLAASIVAHTAGNSGSDLSDLYRVACNRRLDRCLSRTSLDQVSSAEQLTSMLGSWKPQDWLGDHAVVTLREEEQSGDEEANEALPPD